MPTKKIIEINYSFNESFIKSILTFLKSIGKNFSSRLQRNSVTELIKEEEKIFSTERSNECPKCGHGPLAKIIYGLPSFKDPEFQRASAAGEITCGGCCITGMEAKWQCVNCGQKIWQSHLWAEKQALARYSASYRKRLFEETMKANGFKKEKS